MTAEDHEIEQDKHLRRLDERSKKAEHDLLHALQALCRKIGQNRRLLILNSIGIMAVLVLTVLLIYLFADGH